MPGAISGHNSYWLWGPGTEEKTTVILLDNDRGEINEIFGSIEEAGVHHAPYALPYEDNLTVFVCRELKVPLQTLWLRVKHYQ